MASRALIERQFILGRVTPMAGLAKCLEFAGRAGGRALYIKEVDANENTTRFVQEIYDATGLLVAVHQKFPVDSGHKQL